MTTARVVHGDLLDQDVDVIVNAWNRDFIPWWLLLPEMRDVIKMLEADGWRLVRSRVRSRSLAIRVMSWRSVPCGAS